MTGPILVVEDSRITRRMFRVALESQGWSVVEAADGKSALEAFVRERPEVVLQDLTLPDMDGVDLLKRLLDLPGGAEVPVIAMSGFLSKLEEARTLALGFAEHLFKPIDPDRLIEAVRAHLRRGRPDGPGRGRRVIVADDDPIQCRLLKLQFEQAGFTVTIASNGRGALEAARANKPDAIVSDVLMPGMDGFHLCLEVRRDPALASVPVILASIAFTEEPDRRLARSVGANDLVVREPGHEGIIDAVLATLGRSSPAVPGPEVSLPADDYTYRVVRQLERQVGQRADLAGRLALHEAAMGVLAKIGERARTPESRDLIPELLGNALDAAGISIGAVFLVDPRGRFTLASHIGFTSPAAVEDFFGRVEVLERSSRQATPLNVPAGDVETPWERELLERAGARSLLLVPLRLGAERIGVLVLAAARRRMTPEWLPFAEAIGVHIAQAVALTRAVARLAEEQQRLREIAENINEVFFMTTPRMTKFLYVSPAYDGIWGRSREVLFADPLAWTESIHPDDRARARTQAVDAQSLGEVLDQTFRIVRPDGAIRWIRARAYPVREQGALVRYVGTAADTTELQRAEAELAKKEDQLRRSQKMEAVGRLAGGVAHDFNNVLMAVLGYAELVLARLDERDPLRHDIDEIRKAGLRAASLTQQLLVFSRNEPVRVQVLDAGAVIHDMEPMLRRLLGEHISLRVSLGGGSPRVKIDKGHLEQVVLNLCVNARDAMPRGGVLTIEVATAEIAANLQTGSGDLKPGRYVLVSVTDTGCGMDASVLARIFEPFFTTKEVGKGTGLGLSTVYGIVEGASGRVSVKSEVGVGSTFTVHLPRVDDAPTETAAPIVTPRLGTETILLVEDDDIVRSLAHRILENYGYDVIVAANGGEALLACERPEPRIHLVVTDVVMPGLSGPDLVARLKKLRPELSVLFISGYTSGALQHTEALASGMAFIQKPFSPRVFAAKVREILDGPRPA